ncbi:conjugal transfer protein TraF [Bacillus mycoides]|uniref:conjugal transfer protein TraF n=1 Tax=Bacillus mycoides TaxID=1405 RepID=UPI002238E36E
MQEHLKVGERVPLFREKDELNREVVMGDSKGRYTLLIFAEQDCMYCKEILSNLLDAKHKYNLRIIVISAVSLNENIKNKEFHFIVSKELFKNYMITTVPSIMLVDPSSYLLNKPETMHSHGLKIHLNNYFQGVPFKGKQNVQ